MGVPEVAVCLTSEAEATVHRGLALHARRDLDAARDAYGHARALFASFNEPIGVARCDGNLAAVLHDEGAFEEARALYIQCLSVFAQEQARAYEGIFLCNLAILDREEGDAAQAQIRLLRARELVHGAGTIPLQAAVETEIGMWSLEFADAVQACRHFAAARELRRAAEDRNGEAFLGLMHAAATSLMHLDQSPDALECAWSMLSSSKLYFGEITDALGLSLAELAASFLQVRLAHRLVLLNRTDLAAPYMQQMHEAIRVASRASPALASPLVSLSDDARTLMRLLRRESNAPGMHAFASEPQLLVRGDVEGYLSPDGSEVDLRGRPTMRAFLRSLLRARTENRGWRGVEQLWADAWPGERADVHSVRNRVHVALNFFRSHGLRPYLERGPEGYALRAGLQIVWEHREA